MMQQPVIFSPVQCLPVDFNGASESLSIGLSLQDGTQPRPALDQFSVVELFRKRRLMRSAPHPLQHQALIPIREGEALRTFFLAQNLALGLGGWPERLRQQRNDLIGQAARHPVIAREVEMDVVPKTLRAGNPHFAGVGHDGF